ncbi:MAG TPA: hypothetical protein ENN28_00255 [Candidatus Uhrbacteria bacterium]|nr:hypothetical protein [Candidatus Uhrbacteria bacterium]
MGNAILDPVYKPDQFLMLGFKDGNPCFYGLKTMDDVRQEIKKFPPGMIAYVEYMTASVDNARHHTLAEAMRYKRANQKSDRDLIIIQPAKEPDGLHSDLAKNWWNAPRDADFPDFQ